MNENKTEVKGFFLYLDQHTPIAGLTFEQKGMLLDAFFAWHSGQDVVIPDPVARMAFAFFQQQFERDLQRREELIEKNRENGKKGGRPPKNPTVISETQPNPKKPKHEYKHEHEHEYNPELENTHPPTPLKGGGGAAGEKPSRSRETAATIRAAIEERVESPELREALRDFADMRERMKKPLTLKALSLTLRDLDLLASTDAARVAIVEQSIQRGWLGMFALHEAQGTPRQTRASPSPGKLTGEALTRHNMAVAAQVLAELEAEENTIEVQAHG